MLPTTPMAPRFDLTRLQLAGFAGGVLVLGLVVAGALTMASAGPAAGDRDTPTAATPAPVPTVTTTEVAGLSAAPGASADGITDPGALTRHRNATLGANYTLWVDLYWRPANATGDWHQRDIDVAVASDQYLLRAEIEPANASARHPVVSVYRDGDARYVATYAPNRSARYRALDSEERSPARAPNPTALRARTPRELLNTSTTAFTGRVEREGETYYRFVARGTPAVDLPTPGGPRVAPERVRNYSAVVLVDEEGRIDTVEARYTLPERLGARTVRFRFTYDRVGRTAVTRPDWVDAVAATSTAVAARDGPPGTAMHASTMSLPTGGVNGGLPPSQGVSPP